jgi:hypothetical protein
MPEQFSYPERGWSTGRMRKRGQKPDFDWAFGQTAAPASAMTSAQQVFGRSRPELGESASGKAVATPSDVTMGQMMLRGPAGQIVGAAAAMGQIDIASKVKKKLASWFAGETSKDELQQELGGHGWSIVEAEAR